MDIASTVGAVINTIKNAQNAVETASNYIEEIANSGIIFNSESEAQVETEIAKLEALLPALRQKAQDKLRGTGA